MLWQKCKGQVPRCQGKGIRMAKDLVPLHCLQRFPRSYKRLRHTATVHLQHAYRCCITMHNYVSSFCMIEKVWLCHVQSICYYFTHLSHSFLKTLAHRQVMLGWQLAWVRSVKLINVLSSSSKCQLCHAPCHWHSRFTRAKLWSDAAGE